MLLRRIKKNKRGAVLLMTLLILTSIMVASLAATDFIVPGIKMSRTEAYSNIAYYAAETGIERALWEVRKNGYTLPGSDQNIFQGSLANGSSYSVFYDNSFLYATFISQGSYQGVSRSVQARYRK